MKAEARAVQEFLDVLPSATGSHILAFLRDVPADQAKITKGPRRVLFANAVWKIVLKDQRFKSLKDAGTVHQTIVRPTSNCKQQIRTDQEALFSLWDAEHDGKLY